MSLHSARKGAFPAFSLPEQFRYKRRVYAQNLIDDKQFAKLHTKVRRQPRGFGSACFVLWSGAQSRGWGLEGWADLRHHGPGVGGLVLGSGRIRTSGSGGWSVMGHVLW